MHLISVGVEEITVHLVPSERVMLMLLPSSREGGKLVPTIVRMLSPSGFRACLGLTSVTVIGIVSSESVALTGTLPFESKTIGFQSPVVVVAKTQIITVSLDDYTIQGLFPNETLYKSVVGRLVPLIVKVLVCWLREK